MHVLMIGSKPHAVDALLAAGHTVSVLFEAWEEKRALVLKGRVRHLCAVDCMRSVESLWSALHHLGANTERIDAIVTNSEACVVSSAILGKLINARALDPDVALRCRDKAVQKAAWHAAGVATARFVVLADAVIDAAEVARHVEAAGLRAPFFIKPTAGYGSRNVSFARDLDELARLVPAIARQHASMRRLMIEECVPGEEWHLDGVLVENELQAFCVSRYLTPVFQTKSGSPVASISFPAERNPELYSVAREFALRATRSLGHVHGVFHIEAFSKSGTLDFVAGELAARVTGNAASEIIARTMGVDPWVAAALTATGDPLPRQAVTGANFGIVSLPANHGGSNRVSAEQLLAIPGVIQVVALLPVGARMPDMSETSSACIGFALVTASTFESARAIINRVIEKVRELNAMPSPMACDARASGRLDGSVSERLK